MTADTELARIAVGPSDYAVGIVRSVCSLAADMQFFALAGRRGGKLSAMVERHDTPRLFEWLVEILSYQGIADRVASEYMHRHGRAKWADIETGLSHQPLCPKLTSYWQFDDCGYEKAAKTCARPQCIDVCVLPRLPLRNGHLNQMAYSLFLFIRDVAGGDLVAWIDATLREADNSADYDRLETMRSGLLKPMRCIYGVSDKVLSVALADLLLGGGLHRPHWTAVGARMIAVDRLVHNFLHRTGILHRLDAEHRYGPSCYRALGCVSAIGQIAAAIDARQFNPGFPSFFPRFVQHAIWRYCAETGLSICNGNNVDDRSRCENRACRLYDSCDRRALKKGQ